MKRRITLLASVLMVSTFTFAQGFYFGVKGGPLLGFQQWDGFEQNVLLRYHGSAFIETIAEPGEFVLFAQSGYHEKGSALRGGRATDINGNLIVLPTQGFIFRNVDLVLGVKQRLDFKMMGSSSSYYMFGLRGEYTIGTNLEQYVGFGAFYPFPEFVRPWNYGVTIGGGFEFDFSDYVGGILEFSIHPDFSNQYFQPELGNIRNPFTGLNQTLSSRTIRNTTFEISVGFRFLREVIYVE